MPLVSVIVPVRDGERHLRTALDSVLGQTLTDLEVLVVDDGSTDATPAIVDGLAAADPRVRRLAGPATGSAGDARNTALAQASGEYLAFLDADDRFSPTVLEDLHTRAVADRAEIVITGFRVDDGLGEPRPVDWGLRLEHFPARTPASAAELGDHLFLAVTPAPWNKLFRADFVTANGYRFQSLRRVNDLLFTYSALAGATRISHLPGYGVDYRIGHPGSLQSTLHESPLDFVTALDALRDQLQRTGAWPRLERAFTNLVVETSLTALNKVRTPEAFTAVHQALLGDVFPRFGVTGRPDGYFLRRRYDDAVAELTTLDRQTLLFRHWQDAERRAAAAAAEARSALLRPPAAPSPAAPPRPAPAAAARPADDPDGPDVSVVIPVHNTEHYLRQAVASVLAQTGVELEVLCVDDGSSDSSAALLDRLAAADPRVRVFHQAWAGQSAARNAALDLARGRYVCFLDSDDYWRLDELGELVTHADEHRLDLLLFDGVTQAGPGAREGLVRKLDGYYERADGHRDPVPGERLVAALVADGGYRASTCLYLARRTLLDGRPAADGSPALPPLRFREGISREDNLFTFAALLRAGRAAHLPVRLLARRVREGSIMNTDSRVVAASGYFICAVEMLRLLDRHPVDPEVAGPVGTVAFRVLERARSHARKLPADVLATLAGLDPGADAQALHQLLVRDRRDARRQSPAPVPARPDPVRRLLGRGRRAALALSRRLTRRT